MLYEIMRSIRNFFPREYYGGHFKIEGGGISLPHVLDGQYILIEGSAYNDGVYQYPTGDLRDEEFVGDITVLAPPAEFLALAKEIEEYQSKSVASAFTSESFGGYSYSRNAGAGWQDAFRSRLNAWRKI